MSTHQTLIEKLNTLPVERVAAVEDFIDFLRSRDHDRTLLRVGAAVSAPAFEAVWSNPEDDVYDEL